MPVEGVLLEHARLSDESSSQYGPQLGSEEVPVVQNAGACAAELRDFLSHCDGASSLQEIADRLGWPLRQLFAETDYTGLLPQGHYRNQVWADVSQGLMICIGIHGQSIHVNQKTGVVIVKLSSHPEPVDLALFGDTFAVLGDLSSIL